MARSDQRQRFVRSYQRSREALRKLTDKSAKRLLKLLNEFEREVLNRLAFEAPDDPDAPYDIRVIPALLASIEEALAGLRTQGLDEIEKSLGKSFSLGSETVKAMVLGYAAQSFNPFISAGLLFSLARGSQYIYTEMSQRLAAEIDRQVRLSAAGFQSNTETMYQVSRAIAGSAEVASGARLRTSFASQAEAILRTEVNRAFSSAHQASSERAIEIIPDMKKSWLSSPGSRRGHKEAEDKYAVGGAVGPIPVSARFEVTDYSRIGTTEFLTVGRRGGQRVVKVKSYERRGSLITDFLLHPHDPEGSAGNVVNCTCTVINVLPDMEDGMDEIMDDIRSA